MEKAELEEILENHKKWIESDGKKGECADLCKADLRGADLHSANLHCADMCGVDLNGSDLHGVNLRSADMYGANLIDANLRGSNLQYANLCGANLHGADLCCSDLRCSDLRGADLNNVIMDDAAIPLWYGFLDVHVDDRLTIQILYHLVRNARFSKNTSEEVKNLLSKPEIVAMANKFHRVDECGKIEVKT